MNSTSNLQLFLSANHFSNYLSPTAIGHACVNRLRTGRIQQNNNNNMNNNDVPFPGAAAVLSEPKMAAKIKEKSALGHFNNFLKSFWTQNQRQFPPDHTTTRHELIQYEELTPDLFGKFAHYLVNAKHRNEPRKNAPHASAGHQLLSIGSACGYLSAIKIYFIRTRFPNMSTPVAFERKQWLSLNAKLHGLITERCKGIEQPLLNPNRSATLDDWKDLACLCAWNGGSRLAEFWFTCVAMVHMAAKGIFSSIV